MFRTNVYIFCIVCYNAKKQTRRIKERYLHLSETKKESAFCEIANVFYIKGAHTELI